MVLPALDLARTTIYTNTETCIGFGDSENFEQESFNWEDEACLLRIALAKMEITRTDREIEGILQRDDFAMQEMFLSRLLATLADRDAHVSPKHESKETVQDINALLNKEIVHKDKHEDMSRFEGEGCEQLNALLLLTDEVSLCNDFADTLLTQLTLAHHDQETAHELVEKQQQRLESASAQLNELEESVLTLLADKMTIEADGDIQSTPVRTTGDQWNEVGHAVNEDLEVTRSIGTNLSFVARTTQPEDGTLCSGNEDEGLIHALKGSDEMLKVGGSPGLTQRLGAEDSTTKLTTIVWSMHSPKEISHVSWLKSRDT